MSQSSGRRKAADGRCAPEEGSTPSTTTGSLEPRYSLTQAAAKFFPDGPITAASLRTEIKNKRLRCERVAGKRLVTESAILKMLKACEECPDDAKPRDSTSAEAGMIAAPNGTSSMDRLHAAQAAASLILVAPRKPAPGT